MGVGSEIEILVERIRNAEFGNFDSKKPFHHQKMYCGHYQGCLQNAKIQTPPSVAVDVADELDDGSYSLDDVAGANMGWPAA